MSEVASIFNNESQEVSSIFSHLQIIVILYTKKELRLETYTVIDGKGYDVLLRNFRFECGILQ